MNLETTALLAMWARIICMLVQLGLCSCFTNFIIALQSLLIICCFRSAPLSYGLYISVLWPICLRYLSRSTFCCNTKCFLCTLSALICRKLFWSIYSKKHTSLGFSKSAGLLLVSLHSFFDVRDNTELQSLSFLMMLFALYQCLAATPLLPV
jgi:hypothetical protein